MVLIIFSFTFAFIHGMDILKDVGVWVSQRRGKQVTGIPFAIILRAANVYSIKHVYI
jgi:hypothetical protein